MKQIALASITLNAVNPMMECLSAYAGIKAVNYLDSAILDITRKEGHVTDACMGRMASMLSRACMDGADGIILTCTVFTPYLAAFHALFSVPIVSADAAMMEEAGTAGGKIAMICTFPGTLEPSMRLLRTCCKEHAKNTCTITPYVLADAYEAAQHFDLARHHHVILEKVKELDALYDQIVLAQISMAPAVKGFIPAHAVLRTSPAAALKRLLKRIETTA